MLKYYVMGTSLLSSYTLCTVYQHRPHNEAGAYTNITTALLLPRTWKLSILPCSPSKLRASSHVRTYSNVSNCSNHPIMLCIPLVHHVQNTCTKSNANKLCMTQVLFGILSYNNIGKFRMSHYPITPQVYTPALVWCNISTSNNEIITYNVHTYIIHCVCVHIELVS
jgi:hypothetical protein